MKQQATQFGQARQLAEARQQIKDLQEQNAKLATEVKVLRESDRTLFDAQEAMIDALKALVWDYRNILVTMPDVSVWSCDYGTFADWRQRKDALRGCAKELLGEEH